MVEKDKRYYWLKLKRDFFKRHDIRIIESMPNGKDYILFYLKLLCESIDHEGNLRFNDQIPYSESMLSTITNTNVDVVRSAIQIFCNLDMMAIMDDGTYFMNQVREMVGSESYWAERKRIQRQKTPLLENVQQESNESPTCPSKSKSKSKTNIFIPPTVDQVREYCQERKNRVNPEKFIDFYEAKGWMIGKNKMKDWKASVRTWERNSGGRVTEEDDVLEGIL